MYLHVLAYTHWNVDLYALTLKLFKDGILFSVFSTSTYHVHQALGYLQCKYCIIIIYMNTIGGFKRLQPEGDIMLNYQNKDKN